jgi:serine/threonine protein kinase
MIENLPASCDDPSHITTFGLVGQTLAGYRLSKSLGCGCTAEVYEAEEIATSCTRAIKVFANYKPQQHISQQRRVATYASALNALARFQLTPIYYHLSHAFIHDSLGNYFVVQEYIHGKPLKEKRCTREMVGDFLNRLRVMHEDLTYVLRDWEEPNILVPRPANTR